MGPVVTLMVAGKPLTFNTRTRVEACMPPHVSTPKPGPCPGSKRASKGAKAIVKAIGGRKKATAESAKVLMPAVLMPVAVVVMV